MVIVTTRPLIPRPTGQGNLEGRAVDLDGYSRYARLELPTGTWSLEDRRWSGSASIQLADGRILRSWYLSRQLIGGGETDLIGLALVDPESGRWWMGDVACDGAGLGDTDLMWTGEHLLVWERSNGWGPDAPLFGSPDGLALLEIGTVR